MARLSVKTLVAAAALSALATSAIAQADKGEPWVLKMDRGYVYGKDGKLVSYKMGTNNAEWLFRGAKKVPRARCSLWPTTASSTCAEAPISIATARSCSARNSRAC